MQALASTKMTSDTIFFYSKSRDVAPGRGANERIRDPSKYHQLSTYPNWRRVLSNFHISPFHFNGATYHTIEHAFQAAKIALVDPEKAKAFTMESKTPLGLGDGATARKARKMVMLNPDVLHRWDQMSQKVMAEAATAKYAACAIARDVLCATGNAELWHIVPRGRPIRFLHLEALRSQLQSSFPKNSAVVSSSQG